MGISTLHTFIQKPIDNKIIIEHNMDSEYESGSSGFEIHLHGFRNVGEIMVNGNKTNINNESKIMVDRNFSTLEIIEL